MRKENYKIKHKCLLGIFIIGMLIFSEPLYSQNNIIPSNLRVYISCIILIQLGNQLSQN